MVVIVRVPQLRPPSPNKVRNEHWSSRNRRVKQERSDVALVLSPHAPVRLPAVVTLIRCSPGVLDDDNAVASLKAVRDEVARWLGVDDADARVAFRVEQRRVERRDVGVLIEVRPVRPARPEARA